MRRVRDRRPATFFRGTELARLAALVVMLGVLLLLVDRARDPDTWRWIAPDVAQTGTAEKAQSDHPAAANEMPSAAGPTDLDPSERDAAREEFAAVADKVPLGKEEMPAYWRLIAWELRQPTAALRKRALKDVTFRDLWQQPEKWRGKLVEIPVHLRRTLTVSRVAENELGIKTIYEAFGWNSQSQPYWYWMIVPELPPDMPRGENIYEEATFVGYFLKLLPYEDRDGKARATPLLIGRLIWHPAPHNPLVRRDAWTWTWYIALLLVVLLAVRWGLVLLGRARHASAAQPAVSSSDERAIEAWLEGSTDTFENDPPADVNS